MEKRTSGLRFELPAIKDDEILAKVVSDSICMSSHKAALQGADHKEYLTTYTLIPLFWDMSLQGNP